jgi:4-diphosphocytidyl-2-C-methyl-D-erythritol kinase
MKAGLGGGSADAAAAIIGLARLWGASSSSDDLAVLGRGLGADVGFFFTGGAAVGLGRGDEVSPLADLPRLGVLLVMPGFEVSTADAYRWVDEQREQAAELRRVGQVGESVGSADLSVPRTIPRCPWRSPDDEVVNDFEPVVAARHPELHAVTRALCAAGASVAAMSGSGSSVFGLFDDLRTRDRAARALTRAGYRVERARTLSRSEYERSVAPAVLVGSAGRDGPGGLSHPDTVV